MRLPGGKNRPSPIDTNNRMEMPLAIVYRPRHRHTTAKVDVIGRGLGEAVVPHLGRCRILPTSSHGGDDT